MPVTDQDIEAKKQEAQQKKVASAQANVALVIARGAESTAQAQLTALLLQKQLEDMGAPQP